MESSSLILIEPYCEIGACYLQPKFLKLDLLDIFWRREEVYEDLFLILGFIFIISAIQKKKTFPLKYQFEILLLLREESCRSSKSGFLKLGTTDIFRPSLEGHCSPLRRNPAFLRFEDAAKSAPWPLLFVLLPIPPDPGFQDHVSMCSVHQGITQEAQL